MNDTTALKAWARQEAINRADAAIRKLGMGLDPYSEVIAERDALRQQRDELRAEADRLSSKVIGLQFELGRAENALRAAMPVLATAMSADQLTLTADRSGMENPVRILHGRAVVATVYTDREPGDQYDTAARLVACVNACQGIATDAIEHDGPGGVKRSMQEATRHLLALQRALVAVVEYAERFHDLNDEPAEGECAADIARAREALAAAQPFLAAVTDTSGPGWR
jgi:hypothetical protein